MIGLFDSGAGGLSVLAAIREQDPGADLLYVADRARAPYGTKKLEVVRAISEEVAEWLLEQGAESIVAACNTASAAALDSLRERWPSVPIVGMEPAVKPAAARSPSGTVAVFATAATFQGRLFKSALARHQGTEVLARACPEWVTLVESGEVSSPEAAERVSGPVEDVIAAGADTLVLGCTHFSFLTPLIRDVAAGRADVIDPAPAVAAQALRVAPAADNTGRLVLAASGGTDGFGRLARSLVGVDAPVLPFPR